MEILFKMMGIDFFLTLNKFSQLKMGFLNNKKLYFLFFLKIGFLKLAI